MPRAKINYFYNATFTLMNAILLVSDISPHVTVTFTCYFLSFWFVLCGGITWVGLEIKTASLGFKNIMVRTLCSPCQHFGSRDTNVILRIVTFVTSRRTIL